jgi:hypothetical protein
LARGFDSSTIDRLLSAGYTVSKLKQCSDTQLTAFGIRAN